MRTFYLILTIAVLAIFMSPHADASEIYSRDWVGDKYDSIYGDYADPDKIEGEPWICLSPNSTDTGIAIYKFVPPFQFPGLYKYTVSVYGYDSSRARVKTQFGLFDFTSMSGEIVYLGRGLPSGQALVSGWVTSSLERFSSSKDEIWVVILSTPAQQGHIKSVELEIEYDCYPPAVPDVPWTVPGFPIPICSPQEFYIQWAAVPEATKYRLYEDGVILYEGPNFRTDTYSRPGGTYAFTVSAGNDCGWSAQGPDYMSVILPHPGEVEHLYIPSSDQCDSEPFEISWSSATDASSYWVSISETNPPSLYVHNWSTDTTLEISLSPGKYYFRVRAYHDEGCPGEYSPVDSLTVDPLPAGTTPVLYLPHSGATVAQPVTITWSTINNTEYNIQICTSWDFISNIVDEVVGSSNYSASGLEDGTAYYWRVSAGNGCGWSNFSLDRVFITECPVPDAPVLELPVDGATDVSLPVTWDWNDVSGATKYHIQVDDDNFDFKSLVVDNSNRISSDFTWDGLMDATDYYWRVRSGNDCGSWSDWSDYRYFTTNCPEPDPPGLISPLDGAAGLSMPVTLDWDDVADFNAYRIAVDDNSDFSSHSIWEEVLVSEYILSYGLTPGETYYWRARVQNDCGTSVWAPMRSFTMDCPVPDPPTLELPADGAIDVSQPITWDWNDVPGATKYHIEIDNESSDFNSVVVANSSRIFSYLTYDGLVDATDYWWRVRSGNDCGWGDWSDPRIFTTDCPVPDPPILELPADGATDVSQPVMWDWSDISGATKYQIQVDNDNSDFNSLVVDNPDRIASDFTWDGLADGTDYWWRVRSGNDCGWGDWSLVWIFSVGEQTDVQEIPSEALPLEFTLSQNYPNPFNPVTNIDFALPRAAHVRIEVYNILGSRISILVDEYLSAGYKSVEWDGKASSGRVASSGVYLFRITAGEFSASRKALLMK